MTAPRLARAARSRFFIGIGALVLMIGFVAIFHSSQQQLDQSREKAVRCEKAQEGLNVRMQAIVDLKFRLEKSLESERKEHLDTKLNYEQKLKEERDIHNKALEDANIRFETLQQHYKLEKSEHTDLKDECRKSKRTLSEQLNGLERKVKSLETLLTQAKTQHEREVGEWKLKYKLIETRMSKLLQSSDDQIRKSLAHKLEEYRRVCPQLRLHTESTENNILPNPIPLKSASAVVKDFKESIPISDTMYKIPIKIIPKPLGNDVVVDKENMQQQQAPPLKMPSYKSSTSPTDLNKQAVPAASSTSEKTKRSSTHATDAHRNKVAKQLPKGVAPVPENFDDLIKNDEKNDSGNNNNRYANVIEGLSGKNEDAEQENGAHEVKDNDFNLIDDKNEGKDQLMEVLDNMNNNAAEEDTNNIDGGKGDGNNIDEGVLAAPNEGNLLDGMKKPQAGGNDDIHIIDSHKSKDGQHPDRNGEDKLKNEVDGDEGKEAANRPDLHDEPNEEDGDDDEYPINPRQQEGEAVRN